MSMFETSKRIYTITARRAPVGTKVYNFLEKVHYETTEKKAFVLTGTVGEQWVVDGEKLRKTYVAQDGTPLSDEVLAQVNVDFTVMTTPSVKVWAEKVPVENVVEVATSWGDTLIANDPSVEHGSGDYIVCSDADGKPNLDDRWVVNGLVFETTYNM